MLTEKELMVGDWVYTKNHKKYICITPYDFVTHGHRPSGRQYFIGEPEVISGRDLEPIPLTPEILEKNGWEERPTGYVFYTDGKRYDNSLWYIFGSNTFVVNTAEFQIKYVHELQHALRLCGIEKEIEL